MLCRGSFIARECRFENSRFDESRDRTYCRESKNSLGALVSWGHCDGNLSRCIFRAENAAVDSRSPTAILILRRYQRQAPFQRESVSKPMGAGRGGRRDLCSSDRQVVPRSTGVYWSASLDPKPPSFCIVHRAPRLGVDIITLAQLVVASFLSSTVPRYPSRRSEPLHSLRV